MTALTPSWALKIYSKLWLKFKENTFSNQEAKKLIKSENLNQALSRLKRDGWLKIGLDSKDSRRSIYTLQKPEQAINEIIEDYGKAN